MQPLAAGDTVAFVGLGTMGVSMAGNIARAGFRLVVHSRTKAKADALLAAGARWAATPAEAAKGAQAVCLCVPDAPDVEAVLFGAGGAAEGLGQGAIVIDFSTIAPSPAASFAQRLGGQGVAMLDSPVSGGPKGAADGTLTCMVGGERAAFDAAATLFSAVGKTITYLGPAGSGQVCKAANQLIICAAMQAAAEGLALGAKAGLDVEAMRQALLGGSARSAVLENHAVRMLKESFSPPNFRAALMRKDIRIALEAVQAHGVFAPATAHVAQMFEAIANQGRADQDCTVLGQLVAELSGLPRLKG
ncbi:NAD(P)-dependent oxidoreductase [Elioraea rosea]|uniref:NAD(P)-dependent oxidoreductase n=1 Tax=Elioraea rosea TaxID=2492390 RepID=UPI001183C7FD|nr:NAD(P)-dependent oxidoreductase [Elioraea rosea]